MTNPRHVANGHVAEYWANEPAIPDTHTLKHLTEDAVVLHDRLSTDQWIWSADAVSLAAYR